MYLILIILLMLLVVGGLPTWPYTANLGWGYYPSGILATVLIVVLVLLLLGKL
jgi:hypothetical protein